jgi:tRNA pseudouridine13 synthase
VGADVTKKVIQLHNRCLKNPTSRPGDLGRVKSEPIQDKDARTKLHQIVRREGSCFLLPPNASAVAIPGTAAAAARAE